MGLKSTNCFPFLHTKKYSLVRKYNLAPRISQNSLPGFVHPLKSLSPPTPQLPLPPASNHACILTVLYCSLPWPFFGEGLSYQRFDMSLCHISSIKGNALSSSWEQCTFPKRNWTPSAFSSRLRLSYLVCRRLGMTLRCNVSLRRHSLLRFLPYNIETSMTRLPRPWGLGRLNKHPVNLHYQTTISLSFCVASDVRRIYSDVEMRQLVASNEKKKGKNVVACGGVRAEQQQVWQTVKRCFILDYLLGPVEVGSV